MKNKNTLALAFLVTTVFAVSTLVYGAGAGDPRRTIPYLGHLEQNGVASSGPVEMTFTLYDDVAAQAANNLWTQTRTVAVSAGAFSVVLGENAALPGSVFDAAGLFLQVSIGGTALNGLQEIHAVPDAQRAAVATLAEVAEVANALDCPNNSRNLYGLCVVANPANVYTQASAAAYCRDQEMHMCSMAEMNSAWLQGFALCSVLWVSDYISPTQGQRVLVSSGVDVLNCGGAGLNPLASPSAATFGAACCR